MKSKKLVAPPTLTKEMKIAALIFTIRGIKKNTHSCICNGLHLYCHANYPGLVESAIDAAYKFRLLKYKPFGKKVGQVWFPLNREGQIKRIKILNELLKDIVQWLPGHARNKLKDIK